MVREKAISFHSLPKEPLWYLAYGSNLRSSSMSGRNITPLATIPVRVPTHYLTFDVFGIPYSEPCYASIERFPAPGVEKLPFIHSDKLIEVPSLCGIAHLLLPTDFHRLLVTEGSGVVYDLIELEAHKLLQPKRQADPVTLTAYTLKAKWPQRPNGAPSVRYMNLLIEGAKEHHLPGPYIDFLLSFPKYQKNEDNKVTYGQMIFDAVLRPFLRKVVRLTTWRVDENGNCPYFVALCIVCLYQLMWTYHDCFHCLVFGRGDGGKFLPQKVLR